MSVSASAIGANATGPLRLLIGEVVVVAAPEWTH